MNNLKLAYRNLFLKKQNSIIKMISLGTGFAVGLVLLSKVSFEKSYDDFYPDKERIYRIETTIIQNDKVDDYGMVSGAIAPGMKAEVPGVMIATQFTGFNWDGEGTFYTQEKKQYKGNIIMADENLFEIFPRPIISGNAKETLSRSLHALISHSLAIKIGGNPVGRIIELEAHPGKKITIGGIFEDVPENSFNRYDVIVSLESIGHFMHDGRDNWLGNDRYRAYVKLEKGVNPESLAPAIRQMQEKNQPLEEVLQSGFDLRYSLRPLAKLHIESGDVKNIVLILSIISLALLLTALLNYLLIVITELLRSGKVIAVRKCFGADVWDFVKTSSAEALLIFFLALGLSALLLFIFKSSVEEILAASLFSLFSQKAMLLILVVIVVLFALSVFVLSKFMQGINLASAFRDSKRMKHSWKAVLLFVQFGSAAFLLSLTASINKQYNNMLTDHPGYDYEHVIYADLSGLDSGQKDALKAEINKLPQVDLSSFSSVLPLYSMSGNNIRLEIDDRDLFNIAEMYYADNNFLPLMNIPIIAGRNFEETDNIQSVVVSESFRDKMQLLLGWDDVVGRDVIVTEHMHNGMSHIVGVFPDIRISSFGNQDMRPSVLHYSAENPEILQKHQNYLLVKLNELNGKSLDLVNQVANSVFNGREISFVPYADGIIKSYNKERIFRQAIMIGAVITLLILLIGLIGYVNTEIEYRKFEIAVRKVNGATFTNIISRFVKHTMFVALPAIFIGCLFSFVVNSKWMENFSEKWNFSFGEYILVSLLLLILVEIVVILTCIKIVNQNPVDSLKNQ